MILDKIRESIRNSNISEEQLIIRGLWSVDCLFKPNIKERTFNYKFIVAQTIGQGCAYSMVTNYDVKYLETLMGKSYLDLKLEDTALEVAILDAIYSTLQRKPDRVVELNGNSVDKAEDRAKVVAEEAIMLIDNNNLKNEKPLVLNVGVVGNIIKELVDRDIDVIGADFDKEIVGKKLFGKAEVIYGDRTLEMVKKCDVAIITGMTLTTNTLDEIINTARSHNTKLVMFAETGSNLGDFYVQNGVDCVIGEPFPFYIFQGKNTINIFRKR
ncbi:MAG: hypothetical protein K0R09_2299 [Clostridiales bacterium]|jgi:hypothetical protein|nr:hypothetical protein [Clostridiales bacterium]